MLKKKSLELSKEIFRVRFAFCEQANYKSNEYTKVYVYGRVNIEKFWDKTSKNSEKRGPQEMHITFFEKYLYRFLV